MDLILLIGALAIIWSIIYVITTVLPGINPQVARMIQALTAIVLLLYLLSRLVALPNVLPH